MSISIPQQVFDTYNRYIDYMLENDNFSRICKLYYPPIKESCNSCVALGGISSNVYQDGNPAPFNFNSCELCGGKGFREKEVTSEIRLRIFWRPRDWIKVGNIAMPDARCQVIGNISDLKALMTCKFVIIASEEKGLNKDYKLAGKPFLHGFGKTRYFVAYLEDS